MRRAYPRGGKVSSWVTQDELTVSNEKAFPARRRPLADCGAAGGQPGGHDSRQQALWEKALHGRPGVSGLSVSAEAL